MTDPASVDTDVLIIGAGPAGLTAAANLASHLPGGVLVLEREADAGGIPRHSDHLGYGVRDLRTCISGPAYARRLTQNALRAGAQIRTRAMVTGWADPHTVEVTSPEGRQRITARTIILATGARERPRTARLIPGDRPAGVYTTGQLQNLVHLHHRSPGTRAVIVGAELVSWSAAMTLREANCRPILMTTTHPTAEAYAALTSLGRVAFRLPVQTRTRITQILGHGRVQGVEIENLDSRVRRTVECDTVVLTGDWIPDNELARAAHLAINPDTLGPVVDTAQATTTADIYAIGNLTHPVDTADVAALDGRAVATRILKHPNMPAGDAATGTLVLPGRHLKWVSPRLHNPRVAPPRNRYLAWPAQHIPRPTVSITQDGRTLAECALPWSASPGRVLRIPASLLASSGANDHPVTIHIDQASRRIALRELTQTARAITARRRP